jgi:D-aminopeptidase
MQGRDKKAIVNRLKIGSLERGMRNQITDVGGVRVGHATVASGDFQTGVTVIMPVMDNIFTHKCVAAVEVINGFGKTAGTIQIEELGQLESPIALTNTLNVGKVSDALVAHTLERCRREGVACQSFNPVVGECNDSYLNTIAARVVDEKMVFEAIRSAAPDFEEGAVGGGRGMSCHQLKGGIGSASRQFILDDKTFHVGVLVQANYGRLSDLTVSGMPMGSRLQEAMSKTPAETETAAISAERRDSVMVQEEGDKGSIIIVVATDLPVEYRQLKRMLKRTTVGIARVGGYIGHGSGEIAIGFSTANRIAHAPVRTLSEIERIAETTMDVPFRAVAEATEEAVLHALFYADTVVGIEGHFRLGLLDALDQFNQSEWLV